MLKWIARYKIKAAIRFHEIKRQNIISLSPFPKNYDEWEEYVERNDDFWHLASCEFRTIERLKKLLEKYK